MRHRAAAHMRFREGEIGGEKASVWNLLGQLIGF
jgi:hypothetical protein